MAVSSSVGSNIFDVLVGLPLPWLCYTLYYVLITSFFQFQLFLTYFPFLSVETCRSRGRHIDCFRLHSLRHDHCCNFSNHVLYVTELFIFISLFHLFFTIIIISCLCHFCFSWMETNQWSWGRDGYSVCRVCGARYRAVLYYLM